MKITYRVFIKSILVLGFLYSPLAAQEESDSLLTVRVIKVIPGKSGEFEDLQQELSEATKEAGGNRRFVWQETRGDTNTYHIVSMAEDYAQFDETSEPVLGEAAWARWVSRIQRTIDKREMVTLRTHPELEIDNDEGYEPQYLKLTYRSIASGRHAEYQEWLEKRLFPILKKKGIKGYSVGRVNLGGDTSTWVSARFIDSWAELDEPNIFADLSEEERDDLFELAREVNRGSRNLMLRYRAGLSYDGK